MTRNGLTERFCTLILSRIKPELCRIHFCSDLRYGRTLLLSRIGARLYRICFRLNFSVLRSGILTRNGTGLYRIRFRNDFKGLKLGYIDPEWYRIVQDYFVSFYICMCTPELSRIGDIVQDCSIFFTTFGNL